MEHLQRTRLLAIVVLGVIFVSGMVLGRAVDVGLGEVAEGEATNGEEPPKEAQTENRERRTPLYRQVGELTAAQDRRIDSIIEAQRDSLRMLREDFDAFRETYNTRHSEIMEGTRRAIKVVLSPEQAVRYDSLVTEYRNRRREEESGGRKK